MASELRVDKIIPSSGTSIGIGTASGTINILGNSQINTTGVITATSFVASGTITGEHHGNGANLTNIPAANITGTLPAIDGSNLTGVGASFGNSSINTSGIITATALVPTTGQLSHRNIVINGDFTVAQRGSQSTSAAFQTVDRFAMYFTGTDENPTQVIFNVDPPGAYHLPTTGPHPRKEGFRKAFGITNGNQTSGAGAGDYIYISHKIEAQDMAHCGWNYTDANSFITLSFWVKSSAAQNFYGYLKVPDSSTAQHYAFETGALTAFTWKKVVVKIPGNSNLQFDLNTSMGLEIVWSPFFGTDSTSSGASLNTWGNLDNTARMPDYATGWYTTNDASFQITGVQLEVGPVATPFEHLSVSENKRRCYRYCQRGRHISSCLVGTPGTYYFSRGYINLFTPMRATISGTLKAATWNSNRYFKYMTWSSETNVTAAPASVTFSSLNISDASSDIVGLQLHISISSGASNSPLPANGPGSNNVYPIEYFDVLLEAEM